MSDSKSGAKAPRPVPAFHNPEFMESSDARPIRIMSEYMEPRTRFERLNVNNTIVFFGSARTRSLEDAQARVRVAQSKLDGEEAGATFQNPLRLCRFASMASRSCPGDSGSRLTAELVLAYHPREH